ncbi:acetate--CoA ligase family protein [Haloarchaeobius sp. DYHT-AS-18]|uniref:acetate--CoA ligase family protein n=1 Tax=Haloarchaeobius sp. DYHT-AS-18 TaxID=3446117 RepID=UPI003EBA52D6
MSDVRDDQLQRILAPDSVAVVGASTDPQKRGHQAIATLEAGGYEGDVYPVNPSADEIRGRTVYDSVSDIPDPVDLALVVVPAPVVPSVLEDCADTDLAGAVVVAVGFGETDDEGEALERRIVDLANQHDIRLIGPNTSGMINVHEGLNLVGAENVPAGDVALLCQSGNLAIALFMEAMGVPGLGFSHYVGVGNESDLRFDEYLPFYAEDDETAAITLYVEGMSDGRAFLQRAREVTPNTPIVALKGGRSEVGKQSTSSHTGSMAGNAAVADAVFEQAGVISVERADELLPTAGALGALPPADGETVAILADGGGHATLAADALAEQGLSVPDLTAETQARLREVLPDAASVVNPVDVAGGTDDDPTVFYDCAAAIAADPNVDALLLSGLFGGYGIRFSDALAEPELDAAHDIAGLVDEQDIPIVVQSAYESAEPDAHAVLRERGIPVQESLEVATRTIAALATYGDHCARADRKSDFRLAPDAADDATLAEVVDDTGGDLSEYEAREVLSRHDVPLSPSELATSGEEAAAVADRFDGPVAMKVVSPDIVHKSDIGGVALDVTDDPGDTYRDLVGAAQAHDSDATVEGVLVSPMREDGVELVVGVVEDEQFGHVAMVGIGGVFVEVLEDVAFRALPLTRADAREMLADLDAQALLDGARGTESVDREALVDLLVAVSRFVETNPRVTELDLNPVLASGSDVEALDAAMTVRPAGRDGSEEPAEQVSEESADD